MTKKDDRPAADMVARTRTWYRSSDDLIRLRLALPDTPPASCRAGCAHCCSLLVTATLPEGVAIAAYLLDPSRKDLLLDVKQHMSETLEQLRENALTLGDWFKRNQPCLLLSKKGMCRAYEVRPTACRLYFVASDPALCADRDGTTVAVLDTDQERRASLRAMVKVLEAESLPLKLGPLPVVIAWGLKLYAAGFREFKQWLTALPHDHVLSPVFWERALAAEAARDLAGRADNHQALAWKCVQKGLDPTGKTYRELKEMLNDG